MAKRGGIEVKADFNELAYTMGVISGMAKEVRTDRFLSDVIEYVHGQLKDDFNMHMDGMVAAAPQRFSHVYEWNAKKNAVRADEDRLWEHRLLGNGGKRNATFVFRASVKPIPTPMERKNSNPDDPIAEVSDEDLAQLSKRRYIFYWKAPIMEYSLGVYITPKYAQALFIPTGDPSNPFVFRDEFRNPNPGGEETTGAFTLEWANWWGGAGQTLFDEKLATGLEEDLASVRTAVGGKQRNKRVSLSVTTDYEASFEAGEEWSQHHVRKKARKYRRK